MPFVTGRFKKGVQIIYTGMHINCCLSILGQRGKISSPFNNELKGAHHQLRQNYNQKTVHSHFIVYFEEMTTLLNW